ncbi:hypothetical protein, partial [uncultured Bacteroides sp.]|uniref:hypothetical protein n=1 Tax=uncultured Bacteroides sp. TaxID=162156 RepID=UPI0025834A69
RISYNCFIGIACLSSRLWVQAPHVPAEQGQQRSSNERAASPGHGAEKGVWGTTPTSRNSGFRQCREPLFRVFVGTKTLLAK